MNDPNELKLKLEVEEKYKNVRKKMKEILCKDTSLQSKIDAAAEIDTIQRDLSCILYFYDDQYEENLDMLEEAEKSLLKIEEAMR